MFNQTVFVYGYWTDFLYFSRAKFAVLVDNGIRMPFFSNYIASLKR
ncbi:RAxF-45 family protein [Oceanobacillus sp. FSL K6-2867]